MSWKYTYGPVPSRRLGKSLGVSVIPPKVCTYNCVYCQLGRTTRQQTRRESFFPRQAVLDEIGEHLQNTHADYISFVGDGEPTLSSDLGWLISQCKSRWNTPVAVVTNGSLLADAEVRQDLESADVVLPSLDAGNAETYRRVDRPCRSLQYKEVVEGLRLFADRFPGKLWLEVMLVGGVNDSPAEVEDIRDRLAEIRPDRVYVMIPTRPPRARWVKPPPVDRILEAQKILGEVTTLLDPESGLVDLEGYGDVAQAIADIGSRHPISSVQARQIELNFGDTGRVDQLVQAGILEYVDYGGERYVLPPGFITAKMPRTHRRQSGV